MELSFLVNGVTLQPGAMTPDDMLRQAGLAPISRWQRLVRRLPSHLGCWEADDPHVECFGGEVSIYPCRHGYLDRDRRWGTSCEVRTRGTDLTAIEVRVLEGVYAASNLYDRFIDAVREQFGEPQDERHGNIIWRQNGIAVAAEYQHHEHNAIFSVELT